MSSVSFSFSSGTIISYGLQLPAQLHLQWPGAIYRLLKMRDTEIAHKKLLFFRVFRPQASKNETYDSSNTIS